jgi:hypothetical protein
VGKCAYCWYKPVPAFEAQGSETLASQVQEAGTDELPQNDYVQHDPYIPFRLTLKALRKTHKKTAKNISLKTPQV